MSALDIILQTTWQRQGEWGGTTLSRSLTYAGMQRTLADWTGVKEGFEAFLHAGETTFIGAGQYERFASAYLAILERERRPLRAFTQRFDTLLAEVRVFLKGLGESERHGDEKIATYLHLHAQMQPYSYVFGYGEDQVVGALLSKLLASSGMGEALVEEARRAATAPLQDADATATLQFLRQDGYDARALDLADLVREQLIVRTERRILWNKVEDAMRQPLARRASVAGLPVRLLMEAMPQELVRGLPSRAELASRVGTTFLASHGDVHLLTGADHDAVVASLAGSPTMIGDTLVGQSAYPGLVRGIVRIVLTSEDGDALLKCEVLVSDMTTPELTTACSRAAAIVTDRGGILCHAALVAREMQVPTVLGTEYATRILRTGDLVEVDAHRGLVRKILEKRT